MTTMDQPKIQHVWWICQECGTPRTAKLLCGWAKLKCVECGLTTGHNPAGQLLTDGSLKPTRYRDWREERNREADRAAANMAKAELFLTNSGVKVVRVPANKLHNNNSKRYLYSLIRNQREYAEFEWEVGIAVEATEEGFISAVADAIERILTDKSFQTSEKWIGYCFGEDEEWALRSD